MRFFFLQTSKLRCRGVLLKIKAIQEALNFLIDLGEKNNIIYIIFLSIKEAAWYSEETWHREYKLNTMK